eukprot:137446_1
MVQDSKRRIIWLLSDEGKSDITFRYQMITANIEYDKVKFELFLTAPTNAKFTVPCFNVYYAIIDEPEFCVTEKTEGGMMGFGAKKIRLEYLKIRVYMRKGAKAKG